MITIGLIMVTTRKKFWIPLVGIWAKHKRHIYIYIQSQPTRSIKKVFLKTWFLQNSMTYISYAGGNNVPLDKRIPENLAYSILFKLNRNRFVNICFFMSLISHNITATWICGVMCYFFCQWLFFLLQLFVCDDLKLNYL